MKLDEDTPVCPLVESLRDQQAFYTRPGNGPTLQPAFDRWFWLDIPLEDGDLASICCMGH